MADTILERMGRSKYQIFIDWTNDTTFAANVWTRVKKSTQSTYTANEQTEDFDYIDNDDTITELIGNQVQIELDQANIDGDTNYENLEQMMAELPTGEAAKRPILFLFGGSSKRAVRAIASFSDKELSPTDQTISYKLNLSDRETGTYTISDGVPSFTPSTALKVSPTTLTIEKGETGSVTVSGGTAPYVPTTGTANITASMGLDGVTCTVTTNNSSAASDTLTITDAKGDTVTVPITVTEEGE